MCQCRLLACYHVNGTAKRSGWGRHGRAAVGPVMKQDGSVLGAVLTKDETRILSWSANRTLRLWDSGWPKGNLFEIACAILRDHDANNASKHYGVVSRDRICVPAIATLMPDCSLIERVPAAADR